MQFRDLDLFLARNLPGGFLKDRYTRGMRRLAEYGLFRGKYDVKTHYGFSMSVDRLDIVKWFVFYFGWVEPQISKAWSNLLQPGDQVLDIGGNIGYHALLAATLVGPKGKVTTFEPSSRIADQMRENIALNGFDNIVIKQQAVLDGHAEVRLFFGGESSQGSTSTVAGHPSETHQSEFEVVEAVPFVDVLDEVDTSRLKLIKIDVEGAEEKVLSGLFENQGRLSGDIVIFIEISAENAAKGSEWLQPFLDAGFDARLIENRYETEFLRNPGAVRFSPLKLGANAIHDIVLTKNQANFAIMERGRAT